MIEERARVVAVEKGAVWVETLRKGTCSSCSGNAGCGQALMDRMGVDRRRGYIRALSDLQLRVGDGVVIGVREEFFVRGSLLVYLLPLLGIFTCGLLAQEAGLGESLVILAGGLGFALAFSMVRWLSRRTGDHPAMQPIVLHALLNDPVGSC